MTVRVNNSEMGGCVNRKEEFDNHNKTVTARWVNPLGSEMLGSVYVVYSYGDHFPMYMYSQRMDRWFGNKGRYSVTTSRHQSQCRPASAGIIWMDSDALNKLANGHCDGEAVLRGMALAAEGVMEA